MGFNNRSTRKRSFNKRASNKRYSNRNNIKRVSHKRRKLIKGGGFMDTIKTSVGSIFSKVSQYFKPKDNYSIESFEGNFNTLFD